jgi:hypothetical protein
LLKRVALAVGLLVLIALLVGGFWLYRSLQHVPEFYTEALAVTDSDLEQSNREMLRQTAALNNHLRRMGGWEAHFTDQQVNGWLAVDVPKNHPDLLPPEISHPRVQITPDAISVAARFEGDISAVISIELEVALTETNRLAVRIKKLRVGSVPWPLDEVLHEVIAAGASWGLQIEQTQSDGDPVLLVTVPPEIGEGRGNVRLERLELRQGEVYLSGHTLPPKSAGSNGEEQM